MPGLRPIDRFFSRTYGRLEAYVQQIFIDRRYGLPAGAARHISLSGLGYDAAGRHDYVPSSWNVLRQVLPKEEVSPCDVFIDIGCGMGRVVLAAAIHYPFRRVLGVDVVPAFTAVAREAVSQNQHRLRCRAIDLVVADAATWPLPDDVTVAYLFDPFQDEALDSVIDQLIASIDRCPRRLRVIYFAPEGGGPFDQLPQANLIRCGRRAFRRWARADYLRLYEIRPSIQVTPAPGRHA